MTRMVRYLIVCKTCGLVDELRIDEETSRNYGEGAVEGDPAIAHYERTNHLVVRLNATNAPKRIADAAADGDFEAVRDFLV